MSKKVKAAEERQSDVIESYKRAYKLVYGVTPVVTAGGGFLRVTGQSAGVTPKRLKIMTTQLLNLHRSTEVAEATSKQRPGRMFRH